MQARTFILRLLALPGAMALAACAHGGSSQPALSSIVIGEPQEPQSLNPLLLEGAMTELIGPTVFSSLVIADARGTLTPDLATQVPSLANGGISADGLTLTYHLRKGVKWQDGTPLTSADVIFTYSAIMNPLTNVASRSGYDMVARIAAPDPQTVRIRLKRRYSPILANFFGPDQNYQVLPKHLLARYADLNRVPFNSAPIGSGPYRVAAWKRGVELDLTANPQYFRGRPNIRELRVRFIHDSNTMLLQLRTGEANVVFAADPAYLQQYRALPNSTVTRTPVNDTALLLFNTADPQMHDVRVRRAIVEALDVPRLVREASRGAESSAQAARGLFSWAYDPSVHWPAYDPADAKRLLDAAGWQRGVDGIRRRAGVPMNVDFILSSADAESEQIGLTLQQQLSALGVPVSLRKFTLTQFTAPAESGGPLFGGKFQMAFIPILVGVDPNNEPFFGCDQVPPRGFNLTRYCDPRIQAALEADQKTYDTRGRMRYNAIVQQQVASGLPFVPLWRRRSISVYPDRLHGIMPSPTTPYWNVERWRSDGAPAQ